ncbi:MAG: hypothetical protein QOI53_3431 [Verrucomicrobiota bacterium]|jgi:hypothetical protein|nr:hypothetical protein [Verrucomicrobiota bacterium]
MAKSPISPRLIRPGFSYRCIAIFKDPSDVDQERLACRGERNSFAPPLEQIYPQFAFRVVDLLAEWRLRNVQPIGGVGEVQFLGCSDEVF